jgi:enamine deaminase RidA (YjgF/YER057c/UK114 family)
MVKRENIVPKGMERLYEEFHYSPAVKISNIVYVSGQVGIDYGDLSVVRGAEAQFVQAFENLKTVLIASGASFNDVVDLTSYHTSMEDLHVFSSVKDRYFTKDRPAWTAIGGTVLGLPELTVEIKCTAVIKE